jgi:3-oxoacyl-[acyl-carrier protein] reductase
MNCLGKVAIVTGAAGNGMGRSIALTLAREGARVLVNYRTSQAEAGAIVAAIENQGGCALAVQADIFSMDGCQKLVDAAITRFGQVDICILGPGGGWHPQSLDRLDPEAVIEDAHREIAPLYYLMSLVLPGMYARGWGRLIGIGTNLSKLSPAYAYNAAKAARMQALLLAADSAWQHGVTVNVIAPGPFEGIPSLEQAVEQSAHGEAWINRANLSPQDAAEGVAFLCSEAGKYITGCVLTYMFE